MQLAVCAAVEQCLLSYSNINATKIKKTKQTPSAQTVRLWSGSGLQPRPGQNQEVPVWGYFPPNITHLAPNRRAAPWEDLRRLWQADVSTWQPSISPAHTGTLDVYLLNNTIQLIRSYLWHCSRTQSSRAFLADTLNLLCSGEPRGGTGLLLAERLDRLERVSRLVRDSMEDWRELNERPLANSSIWQHQQHTVCVELTGSYIWRLGERFKIMTIL